MTYKDILNIFKYYKVYFHSNCKGDLIVFNESKNNFAKCKHYFEHYAKNKIIEKDITIYDMHNYKVIA